MIVATKPVAVISRQVGKSAVVLRTAKDRPVVGIVHLGVPKGMRQLEQIAADKQPKKESHFQGHLYLRGNIHFTSGSYQTKQLTTSGPAIYRLTSIVPTIIPSPK